MSALVLLLALVARGQAPAGPVDLLITDGTVVTMDPGGRVLEGGAVAVRGERIEAVLGPGEALPEAQEIVDARGHLVIPGPVNAHGHAAMTLLRGIADDLKLLEWLAGAVLVVSPPP